jgi:hypothetical protein
MIRKTTYRSKSGFSVTGHNQHGQRFRIFAKTEEGARQVFTAAKQGDSATVDRLLLTGK